jgi:hypothetical protein
LPRMLAITGHPRSGTSMLARLCNTHPQVRVAYEFRMFKRVDANAWRYARTLRRRRMAASPPIPGRDGRRPTSGLRSRLLYARFVAGVSLHPQRVRLTDIRRAAHHLWPEAAVAGDKEPVYREMLPQLASQPGLQIVVIYRDCRDVVQSVLARMATDWAGRKFHTDSAAEIARHWSEMMEAAEALRDRLHLVRYEALVAEPDEPLAALGNFLQVDGAGFNRELLEASSVGKWRAALTPGQIDEIVAVAAPTMARWGYV